ncbi:hypothetical protein GOODEAATRI_002962 [Goodea atripinnis]|uniref:Exonuclease domain-containing protein n=1 Tax=Goodea atripinnis TaxID=208336 RepID=A0ABV0P159_9TELE
MYFCCIPDDMRRVAATEVAGQTATESTKQVFHSLSSSSISPSLNGIKTPNAFFFLWQTGDYTPANDNSLHELERLDKEIETVRHEVEQEQRRLSCYQTSQADRISNKLVTRHETSASYGLSSSKEHKSHVQSKYVVDNSKPRTDLEYDPLSNFSAALQSYSSSGNEHKGKTRQDGTSSRSVHFGEKPSTHQVQMYRTQSPENLDDSTEDGVLVIDVSLSPNGTSDQPQNTGDLASGKSSQDTEKDVKEIKTVKVFLDSPTQKIKTKVVNAASLSASSNNANNVPDCCSKESNPVLPTFDKTKGYRNEGRSVVDLTGCLEELERESKNTGFQSPERVKKMTDSASFSTISDQPYHLGNPQIELTCNNEKTMSQPDPTSRLKRPAREQASITEQKQGKVQSHFSSVQSVPSVAQDGEETTSKMAVKTDMNTLKSQKRAEAGQASCQIQSQNVTSVNPHGRAESSESTEQLLQEDDEAVIIINSSSEDDDISYSEMDISDSDPMEECYRIFMEANGKDGGHEQCTTSEPAASGFVSRPSISSKIQQVQQRASVLTAQVKAGQKLVSSVIQKKPETQTVPSALTPTPENFQPSPVQNGLELSRVTVINSNLQVIYDTFVRPDNEVIDYNTRFSGISEEDVKGNHTSLREVQETLLSFISADTILVGHGLETDLCLLKVTVANLFFLEISKEGIILNFGILVQLSGTCVVCGHDTGEDAAACMELMLWKMKEDGKLKK